MYAVLHRYHFAPTALAEIRQQMDQEYVPRLRQSPGFVAYYWVRVDDGQSLALSLYESQADAEIAQRTITAPKHLLAQLMRITEQSDGEVEISAWCSL